MSSQDNILEHYPIELSIEQVKPVFSIIGYQSSNNRNPYLEFRDIDNKGNVSVGKPLYKSVLKDLLKNLNTDFKADDWYIKDILNNDIINFDIERKSIVFIARQAKRFLHFKEHSGIKSGNYFMPNTIFKYENENLNVYAIKKLSISSTLYHAPYWNISENGSLCWGNLKFKPNSFDVNTISDYLKKLFFGSNFTHSNCSLLLKDVEFKSYMNSILDKNEKFNTKLLVPTNLKLKDIL